MVNRIAIPHSSDGMAYGSGQGSVKVVCSKTRTQTSSFRAPALRHDERGRGAVAEERRVGRGVRPVRLDEGRLERAQLLQGGVSLHAVLGGASVDGDNL